MSDSITSLATQFRALHNLGQEDPIDVLGLLHSLDVLTVFQPLSKGFSGMAQITNGHRFMLINTTHPLGKQNFTICHELYHLYIQKDFTAMVCNTGLFEKKDKEEYNADCFAADLLIPQFGIIKLIPRDEIANNRISLRTILKIEHTYGVSRKALLHRLKVMKMIDSNRFDDFSENIVRGAAEHGYRPNLYRPTNQSLEVIGDYGDKARSKYEDGNISESHYISLLHDIGIDLDETIDDYVD
ncbi:ImmA/IrrE family metallo-endopeptidase [Fluviicola sp.]|uniref:ImmA/IrrE family metallo-endopeptidase n=1 Tax=Fluviicola sp. TaxID=1917219 RepID=UPI003D2AF105